MKQTIIITDGTTAIQSIAEPISEALEGFKVKICTADCFAGNDLLPCDIFFIGCEKPTSASFAYLADFLNHVNLASRKCALFSIGEETMNYLKSIINTCEADLVETFIFTGEIIDASLIKNWIKKILEK